MRHGGSTCSSPRGPSARAWAARIGLDDGRLRDGRSSVEGLSAAALPGFPSPRLTFADRLRGDKAPDVLIEILGPDRRGPRPPTWSATARCAAR
jgi:hypothetical protein